MAGIAAALRKRIRQIYWIVLFVHLVCFFREKEKKGVRGKGGACYTFASLTLDKRIFPTSEGLQSNVHEKHRAVEAW